MGKHKNKYQHSDHRKKKKRPKEQDSSSSSENEWVEAESVQVNQKNKFSKRSKKRHNSSSDESSAEPNKKKESKRDKSFSTSSNKNERRVNLNKNRTKRSKSSSNTSSDEISKRSCDDTSNCSPKRKEMNDDRLNDKDTGGKREEWMDLSTSFSSFSNIDRRKQKEQDKKFQKQSEQYNPSKAPRELNPYWRDGGDGLPKFQKPKFDDSDGDSYSYTSKNSYVRTESSWRKNKIDSSHSRDSKIHDPNLKNERSSNTDKPANEKPVTTEKELNLLAGKLVKAEIMGDEKLIKELKEKLENAREALEVAKSQDKEVLLTKTDRQGHVKPLTLQNEYGESSNSKKQRKKAVDTHQDKQRVRYFPDDDKYSLKQMFEEEKFNTTDDQDSEFMKIASSERKNDDLDDFFADSARRKKSDSKIDETNRNRAINEYKTLTESLDSCSKCIQSSSMQKHLIISMGEYVYLSIPYHEPLTEGHCLIVPIRHVCSVTQLDENEWSEILDFRKALVRLAQSRDENPIFFEIATGFHKYPHMILECVPLPKEEGDMAPIYFKKAIDESEIEWAQNKKLVSLKDRDVRRAIPKGLPYFSVSFGMEEGFAHVIEDDKLFPRNFAQEIIGGMLDLHHSKWRKPGKQSFTNQSKRVLEFSNQWKNFDCTVKS